MTRNLSFILLALIHAACGSTQNTPFPGLFGGEVGPYVSSPTPGTGGPNPGGSVGGNGSGGGTKTYPTTNSGGYFTVSALTSLVLSSNSSFHGITADTNNLYVLLYTDSGSQVRRWEIKSQPKGQYTAAWTTVCSILDDNKFCGFLRTDEAYFYIGGGTGSSCSANSGNWDMGFSQIRRFRVNSCQESSAITIPFSTYATNYGTINGMGFGVVSDGTILFLGSGSPFISSLVKLNSSTGTYSSIHVDFSLGNQQLRETNSVPVPVITSGSDVVWVVDGSNLGGSIPILWRVSQQWSSRAWAPMPTKDYPTIGGYSKDAASIDANSIVLVFPGNPLPLLFLDVTNF